jgi:pSer/pThr/pTyr-binding forkhead associated (FHA) protein
VLPSGVATVLVVFDTGQRERIPAESAVTLGRNPTPAEPGDLTIAVEDPQSTVSKNHVRVEHTRGQTWVTDLGSTNGTKVITDLGEVTTLRKGERRELEEGARVRLGNRSFTVSPVVGGDT